MAKHYSYSIKQVLISKYNYKSMETNAPLVFLSQEVKEFVLPNGNKDIKHYGYFTQNDSSEVYKIKLLSDQKFEKYKSYNVKLKIRFFNMKRTDGTTIAGISYSQIK